MPSITSLEDAIQDAGNPVTMLRNLQTGPNAYPGVPPEYTNWRDETQAWQKTCVLFNQSYHMVDLALEGPDAITLLSHLGVNSFASFGEDKAKQFVPCSHDGFVIGDVILFGLGDQQFNLVGRIPALNWIRYHAATGGYDVRVELDERSAARPDPFNRRSYRFQLQGPNAMKTMEKVLGAPPPDLKFFTMGRVTIAGRPVRILRHGMAGQPGFEMFGPYADGDAVREAVFKAGEEFGLHLVGGRAYSANTLESGWVPSPLPAIYTGERMKPYRQWLPADCYEARASIGGSFASPEIEDYYLTPWDLGYGGLVKFDHDFIGREALERRAKGPHRKKVTLALNTDDVMRAIGSQFQRDHRAKFIEFPSAVYSMHPYDQVTKNGKAIGVSTWVGYSANAGQMLTLAILEPEHAVIGNDVTFVWGEENGGTAKPAVERHEQMEMRATVSPVPYSEVARTEYAGRGWRTTR